MPDIRMLPAMVFLVTSLSLTAPSAPAQTAPSQDADLRFTAASLKPLAPAPAPMPVAPSGEAIISERVVRTTPGSSPIPGMASPGRMHYVATLRELLANAYGMKEYQVEGPDWMDTERFVLDATMPPETARSQRLSMLKNLLVDRFNLTVHRDTKELPMYSLAVAKNGPMVKESSDAAPNTQAEIHTVKAGGSVRITAQQQTINELANQLTIHLNRPVKNETGLGRSYDFVLAFSSDDLSGPAPSSSLPDARDLPDLFSALQTQLGLKLVAKKEPAEVIVVDHIDRSPREN